MLVKVFKKTEGQIDLYGENDDLLGSFEIKDNLQRSLEILKQLNAIKTVDGIPAYRTRMFKGKSVWAFHQHYIFYNFLWDYAKYEPVLRFLHENRAEKMILDKNLDVLKRFLKINGVLVLNGSSRGIVSIFAPFFMKTAALMVTFLALLKIAAFRTKILVYTPDKFSKEHDCDFRFYPAYQYLKEKKLNFIEIFHSLLNKEFLGNIIGRKRLALYLEVFPLFEARKAEKREYDLSIFEPHNRKTILHLLRMIDLMAQNSIKRIRILTWLLKVAKIKTLLALDEARYINELILACRLNEIKTYGFQHGQFTKYHVGYLNYNIPRELSVTFDKLFVWNEYWKRALLSYSTQYGEENVQIGGALRELKPIRYRMREGRVERLSDLRILAPYETFAPKKEVGDFLNRFMEFGIKVLFKPRPDLSCDDQFNQYDIKYKKEVEIIKNIDAESLSKFDAFAGTYSTFLNELLFYDKPLFILASSFDLGHLLIEDHLGFLLKKDFDPQVLLDYINNYQSKKDQAWPKTSTNLRETLDKILDEKNI